MEFRLDYALMTHEKPSYMKYTLQCLSTFTHSQIFPLRFSRSKGQQGQTTRLRSLTPFLTSLLASFSQTIRGLGRIAWSGKLSKSRFIPVPHGMLGSSVPSLSAFSPSSPHIPSLSPSLTPSVSHSFTKSLTHSFTHPYPILLQNRSQETFFNSFQPLLSFLWSGNKSLEDSIHQWPMRSARYLHPHTVAGPWNPR